MSDPLEIVFEGRKLSGMEFRETGQLWSFNGVANLAQEPLFRAERGETVIVETINDTVFPHAMHVHGHHFRVIERGGSQIDESRPWRDTFLVGPNQ